MSIFEIDATFVTPVEHRNSEKPSTESGYRSQRRPAESIAALSDRIRAMQRAEPSVSGDVRTRVLSELAIIDLEVERLALHAWRSESSDRQTDANSRVLAEQVDQLAVHWPLQAEPEDETTILESLEESARS